MPNYFGGPPLGTPIGANRYSLFNPQNRGLSLFQGTTPGQNALLSSYLQLFRDSGSVSDDIAFAPVLDNLRSQYDNYFTEFI